MRTTEEIKAEIDKVNTSRKNAARKVERCLDRLDELKNELKEAEEHDL